MTGAIRVQSPGLRRLPFGSSVLRLVCVASCLVLAHDVSAKNILYINPFTAPSHYTSLEPISLALARKGYNVTVIAAHRVKNPPAENYHEITTEIKDIWAAEGQRTNVFDTEQLSYAEFMNKFLWTGGKVTTEISLNSSAVRDLLADKGNTYDLVISELFIQEAHVMFAEHYDVPLILVTTVGNCMRTNYILRNPLQLPYILQEYVKIESPNSLYGRLKNLYAVSYELFWWHFHHMPGQEELVDKYFPDLPADRPSIRQTIQERTSLLLLNSHFSADTPTAYLPNIIEVGGMHLKEASPLPKDLKDLLDKATNGVVYMNFGSNIKSTEMPKDKLNAFLNVFRKLNQTVLWKWEDTNLVGKPENVVTRSWLPQNDVLGHPNVKVFIGHGGLLGVQEGLYHGVPMIGIPIFADQLNNILFSQEAGNALLLRYTEISEAKLEEILNKILNNPSYSEKAKELSVIFRDRPMNGIDTAIFWIEYVLRHNGAAFMRSPGLRMSWYSYYMLDTLGILVLGFTIVTIILFNIFPRLIKKLI